MTDYLNEIAQDLFGIDYRYLRIEESELVDTLTKNCF